MKIEDKYSIDIVRNKRHTSIKEKDVELILDIIKKRDFNPNTILEEISDLVRIYFINSRWSSKIIHYDKHVFIRNAYIIEMYKSDNDTYSLMINLLEKNI